MTAAIVFWLGEFGRQVAQALAGQADFRVRPAVDFLADNGAVDRLSETVFVFDGSRFAHLDLLQAIDASGCSGLLVDLTGRDLVIGPRLRRGGPCLNCCVRRYLGSPGDPVRAEWEGEVARDLAAGAAVAAAGFDAATVALAAALCREHLEHQPAGGIVRLDLMTHFVRRGVALPHDDCGCGADVAERDTPADRLQEFLAW